MPGLDERGQRLLVVRRGADGGDDLGACDPAGRIARQVSSPAEGGPARDTPHRRRAPPRSAAAGCTSRRDRVRDGAPGLDLPGVHRDREVRDRRVLRLARAVRDRPSRSPRRARARSTSSDSVSVPIWFTFTRIAFATPSSIPRRRKSTFVTKRSSPTSCTRSPSVVGESCASRPTRSRRARPRSRRAGSDRRARGRSRSSPAGSSVRPSPGSSYTPSRNTSLAAGSSAIADPLAVSRALGRLEDRLDRLLRRLEIGGEAALVADAGREPALVEHRLQRGETPPRRCGAPRRSVSAPAGTTMNSCRSSRFCACAPPLITFISGTGSVRAASPPSQR